ncbi:MAG: hypothetical protein HFG80_09010, partial [Eubacterium sp.]|nr:hypothetical protein [Eubacterium sp.]
SLNVFCAPDSSGAPLKSFKVIPLFSYQCPLRLLSKPLFVFVVNRQLLNITTIFFCCQQLFLFFLNSSAITVIFHEVGKPLTVLPTDFQAAQPEIDTKRADNPFYITIFIEVSDKAVL